ncbi:MAG: hypothetical protein JWL64_1290 [Frankiales bacterium]|nr:hypothetical protein [Frankiales bacterium]
MNRRPTAVLAAAALVFGILSLGMGTEVAASAAPASGSAMTVQAPAGSPFAGLKVTLGQTKDLVNQTVPLTWSGAAPTASDNVGNAFLGKFNINYLQIMQCWGDAASGPIREQCQFGGRSGVDERGSTTTRYSNPQDSSNSLKDPLETLTRPPGTNPSAIVPIPFESVTGERVVSLYGKNEFYDAFSTNEIPFGRTRPDGTGEEFFELQTIREAPGLGCGQVTSSHPSGRACWLVVVPRSNREVDGTPPTYEGGLTSSPLSETNWRQRLTFPLSFAPVERACSEGVERPVVGQEIFVEAMTRWQPTLCAGGERSFAYTQISDGLARQKLTTDKPGLTVTTRPLDPADVPADRRIVYAPVALSAMVLGALVETAPDVLAPAQVQQRAGLRINDLKLTPSLVAKLLTQSYQGSLPPHDPDVAANPKNLDTDPEFLALNPEFGSLFYSPGLTDLLVPTGQSDAAALLWTYVLADPEARDFLAGKPDAHGMKVNPAAKGISAPPSDFPKPSQYCDATLPDRDPLCALDYRPFVNDFHDAGRNASRGDNVSRVVWKTDRKPPAYDRDVPPASGNRAILAVTDAATAVRYGLTPVRLRNAAGQFVAPDEAGLLSAQAAMTPTAVPGVLQPDVTSTRPDAYPLTALSYAAAAPAVMDKQAAADYADVLRFAAGPGQTPGFAAGTLPLGYAPLPAALRAQTMAAATQLQAEAGVPVTPADQPGDQPAGTDPEPMTGTSRDNPDAGVPGDAGAAGDTTSGAADSSGGDTGGGASTSAGAAPVPAGAGSPAAAVDAAPLELRASGRTEHVRSGAQRWTLLAAAVLGVLAALARPAEALRGPALKGVRQLTNRRPTP